MNLSNLAIAYILIAIFPLNTFGFGYFSLDMNIDFNYNTDDIIKFYQATVFLPEGDKYLTTQSFIACGLNADQEGLDTEGIFGPARDENGLYWGIRRAYYTQKGMEGITIKIIGLCDNVSLGIPDSGTIYVPTQMIKSNFEFADQGITWDGNELRKYLVSYQMQTEGFGSDCHSAIKNAIWNIIFDFTLEDTQAAEINEDDIYDLIEITNCRQSNLHDIVRISCYELHDCELNGISNFKSEEIEDGTIKVSFKYNLKVIKDKQLLNRFYANLNK